MGNILIIVAYTSIVFFVLGLLYRFQKKDWINREESYFISGIRTVKERVLIAVLSFVMLLGVDYTGMYFKIYSSPFVTLITFFVFLIILCLLHKFMVWDHVVTVVLYASLIDKLIVQPATAFRVNGMLIELMLGILFIALFMLYRDMIQNIKKGDTIGKSEKAKENRTWKSRLVISRTELIHLLVYSLFNGIFFFIVMFIWLRPMNGIPQFLTKYSFYLLIPHMCVTSLFSVVLTHFDFGSWVELVYILIGILASFCVGYLFIKIEHMFRAVMHFFLTRPRT